MAVPPRFFEDGAYYHVYNRGNRKQQIFFSNRDYERFLEKIIEYKKKYPVEILSYCLMPNHFHFLIQQLPASSISKFMSDLCNSHSRYLNVKYEFVGSLFQGRFKAKRVDTDEYLVHLSRYIHLNPVELLFKDKNIFERLTFYKWSSLSAYLSGKKNDIANPQTILDYFLIKDKSGGYRNFLESNVLLEEDPTISHLTFKD